MIWAPSAGDPVAQRGVGDVDPGERADLAVEDDREALREVGVAGLAREVRQVLPALVEVARDLVELVTAAIREVELDDGLVAGAERPVRPVRVEILPRQLGHRLGRVVRLVLVEVVVGRPRSRHPDAGTERRRVGAGQDDLALGDRVELGALRLLAAELPEDVFLRLARPGEARLVLRIEVPLRRGARLRRLLLPRKERQELSRGVDHAARARRRRQRVGLEVEELELRGLADDLGRAAGIVDACELNRDLIGSLARDDRLGDAELVDALAHDLDRAVEILLRDLPALRRLRLEDDLEPALEVEAERRRAEEREHDDPDDGGQNRGEDEEVAAHS